jgi:hypothetical protein
MLPARHNMLEPLQVEEFWEDLLAFIEDRRVIPIVGAELLTVEDGGSPVQGELAHTTKETELNRINKHISPRWGRCLLKDVKPYPVQAWLRKLPVAPKTKGHLRGLM